METGLWVNHECTWLNEEEWIISVGINQTNTWVRSTAYHKKWKIHLNFRDYWMKNRNTFIREFEVSNQGEAEKNIQLLIHSFSFKGQDTHDATTYYSAKNEALIHYKKNRYSLFSASLEPSQFLFCSAGSIRKIWDGEKGKLLYMPLYSDGQESLISMPMTIQPNEQKKGRVWGITDHCLLKILREHLYVQAN